MDYYPNYYHVFNRGVEKRKIFCNASDYERFILGLKEFNNIDSAVELRHIKEANGKSYGSRTSVNERLVEVVAYCLNPNHYHLILKEEIEGGTAKFIQKLATGYTNYFNKKYKRSGVLFQGQYKRVEIKNNPQLLYLSAYVNGNYYIHGIEKFGKWKYSSLPEYSRSAKSDFCYKDDVIKQLGNAGNDYNQFCKRNCDDVRARRNFAELLLEK